SPCCLVSRRACSEPVPGCQWDAGEPAARSHRDTVTCAAGLAFLKGVRCAAGAGATSLLMRGAVLAIIPFVADPPPARCKLIIPAGWSPATGIMIINRRGAAAPTTAFRIVTLQRLRAGDRDRRPEKVPVPTTQLVGRNASATCSCSCPG